MRIEMVSIGTSTPPLLPLKRCVECLKMKQQIDSLSERCFMQILPKLFKI